MPDIREVNQFSDYSPLVTHNSFSDLTTFFFPFFFFYDLRNCHSRDDNKTQIKSRDESVRLDAKEE